MLMLTETERAMLGGERGPAVQMAMSILAQMAQVYGAERLIEITAAHIDSTIYVGEANLEFAERLADLGARVAVPSTLNVSGVDEGHWHEWSVPASWAQNARRQMAAYESMGCIPSWTCAPYQTQPRPHLGQQVAWGESSAIVFANSVLGARTERYPDLLDICCAITGRAPAIGLHLTENRAGQILVNLVDVPPAVQRDPSLYPVVGYLLGQVAGERVPVLSGLEVRPAEAELKALGAAAASSGRVALFHIVGVTPEAPTPEAAFQNREPLERLDLTMDALRIARQELDTDTGEPLDLVFLGCPHLSLDEFGQLAPLLEGKQAHPEVRFLVASDRTTVAQARQAGYLATLEAFGGQITVDTCPLATPMLPPDIKKVMTDSGKHAYYAPGLLDMGVAFGKMADCVRSAVAGRVVRDEAAWKR
jgi:predicted aconitase